MYKCISISRCASNSFCLVWCTCVGCLTRVIRWYNLHRFLNSYGIRFAKRVYQTANISITDNTINCLMLVLIKGLWLELESLASTSIGQIHTQTQPLWSKSSCFRLMPRVFTIHTLCKNTFSTKPSKADDLQIYWDNEIIIYELSVESK